MENDKELEIMTALSTLDPEPQARIVRWAAEKFKIVLGPIRKALPVGAPTDSAAEPASPADGTGEFNAFSDLYDSADPKTDGERVLVAGYWFQIVQGTNELDSQSLNRELNNLGHAVGHMPHCLDDLMNAKPRLIIQLKKKGKSRQARRQFKLTMEGIKRVKEMLARKPS